LPADSPELHAVDIGLEDLIRLTNLRIDDGRLFLVELLGRKLALWGKSAWCLGGESIWEVMVCKRWVVMV
jgi:hypothetical protein